MSEPIDAESARQKLRFASFVAKKTADALSANCDPYVTEIAASSRNLEAVGNEWTRRLFDGDFYFSPSHDRDLPACSLVFVQSKDGNTGADDPSVLGGGDTDKHVIYEGLSQVAADAVLSGANTVRDSDMLFAVWHPELVQLRSELGKPRFPLQIVATVRGMNLDSCLLFNVPEVPACVLTVAAGAARMQDALAVRPWVRTILMEEPSSLRAAFGVLHDLGVRRISAVGGRHLARQLIDAQLVQDLYLTTSVKQAGEPGTPLYRGMLLGHTLVRKHGTERDNGVLFEHVQLERLPQKLEDPTSHPISS